MAKWDRQPAATRWERLVAAVLQEGPASLHFGGYMPQPFHLADMADEMSLVALAMLWLAEDPVPADAFVGMLETAAEDAVGGGMLGLAGRYMDVQETSRRRIDDVLSSLTDAGVVRRLDGQVSLTPASARLLVKPLREAGFDVLTPEDLDGLGVDEFLDLVSQRPPTDVDATSGMWIGERDRRTLADEIVACLVAEPMPARLLTGFTLLAYLGADAVDAIRGVLDDDAFGPHAWLLLVEAGEVGPEEAPPHLVIRAGIDSFLATADAGSPADVMESFLTGIDPEEHTGFVDTLATSDHPRTAELLDLLGQHHPDEAVAKHARKAALRLASA